MDGGLVGPTWRGGEGDYSMGGVVRLEMVRVQGIRTEVEVRDTAQQKWYRMIELRYGQAY